MPMAAQALTLYRLLAASGQQRARRQRGGDALSAPGLIARGRRQGIGPPLARQAAWALLYASGQSERDASAVVTLYPRQD